MKNHNALTQTCITTITSVDETFTTFKKELFDLINGIIEHRFLWEEIINLIRANNNSRLLEADVLSDLLSELFDLINGIIEHRFLWEEIINLIRANNNSRLLEADVLISIISNESNILVNESNILVNESNILEAGNPYTHVSLA